MKNQSYSFSNCIGLGCRTFLRFCVLSTLCLLVPISASAQSKTTSAEKFVLQAQDLLRITFPGAPELDSELQIRRDGVVSLPIIGEVYAAGKSPRELETELATKYEDQLVSNEVMVVVVESQFTYYLEGEVQSPGIINSFRQLSVLEAIIAAGGINKLTGKMKSVVVIRRKGDKYQHFELDLAAVIDGKKDGAFVLESYDIVSVPQKVW